MTMHNGHSTVGRVIVPKNQANVTHPTDGEYGDSYTYREMGKSKILRFGPRLGTAQRQFPEVVEGATFSTYRHPISVKIKVFMTKFQNRAKIAISGPILMKF